MRPGRNEDGSAERKKGMGGPSVRRYARLKEPLPRGDGGLTYKIMLYEAEEGVYLFEYDSPDAVLSVSDRLCESAEEVCEDWNDQIDERGWTDLGDPLPGCQHDAFIPLRVKGRDTGRPEWGYWETLRDGRWVPYPPG